jgi:hypothetical protein
MALRDSGVRDFDGYALDFITPLLCTLWRLDVCHAMACFPRLSPIDPPHTMKALP